MCTTSEVQPGPTGNPAWQSVNLAFLSAHHKLPKDSAPPQLIMLQIYKNEQKEGNMERIKRDSSCNLTFFCWHEISCTKFRKIYIHFLRSLEENVEIVIVKITLVNLVLWYLGCFNFTHILYSRATRQPRNYLKLKCLLTHFLKVNSMKERNIFISCDCKLHANIAPISPAPRIQRVSAANGLGLHIFTEYLGPWLFLDKFGR